jgi:hypothetical protein
MYSISKELDLGIYSVYKKKKVKEYLEINKRKFVNQKKKYNENPQTDACEL